ncbi:hypothetical protein ACFT5C_18190 [Streptomyces sp. NPDC057116]|uniref:hypothetical protein n=1 Tax=Streptomyces sp. NPDC057116 TaxID=3346023 RepID=UPI0036319B69
MDALRQVAGGGTVLDPEVVTDALRTAQVFGKPGLRTTDADNWRVKAVLAHLAKSGGQGRHRCLGSSAVTTVGPPGRALDPPGTVDRRKPLDHACQAGPDAGPGAAVAVVAHDRADAAVGRRLGEFNRVGAAVLGDIGEDFGGAEVEGPFHRLAGALRHVHVHSDRSRRGGRSAPAGRPPGPPSSATG